MARRRPLVLALISAVVLVAVVAVAASRRERPQVVDVERVTKRAPFQSWVSASGEIVAARYADIGSSVMGRLVELTVREGDAVIAGQVLARIDPVPARTEERAAAEALAALESDRTAAAAQEREALQAAERARSLSAQQLNTGADLDQAEAAAAAASARREAAARRVAEGRARLARARDALAKTEIAAPMDGVVSRLAARAGEMVVIGVQNQPGTILMTLSDLSSIDAEVKVAEADVLRLATGQRAIVTLEALPGREFPGAVVEIGASALPVAGTAAAAREFRVLVRLDKPGEAPKGSVTALRPGLTSDVRILAEERSEALTVPLQAVVLRTEGAEESRGVFRIDQGRARFAPVTTGIFGGLEVQIDGLPEGAEIVVGPYAALRELADGARVKPRSAAG